MVSIRRRAHRRLRLLLLVRCQARQRLLQLPLELGNLGPQPQDLLLQDPWVSGQRGRGSARVSGAAVPRAGHPPAPSRWRRLCRCRLARLAARSRLVPAWGRPMALLLRLQLHVQLLGSWIRKCRLPQPLVVPLRAGLRRLGGVVPRTVRVHHHRWLLRRLAGASSWVRWVCAPGAAVQLLRRP